MNLINYFKNGEWKGTLQGFGMKASNAKPEIMLITGMLSVLIGTVHACTKTEKAKEIAVDTKNQLSDAESALTIDAEKIEVTPETQRQLKLERGRAYARIYGHAVYEYVKLYGVSALFWFGGMGFIGGGHHSLRVRNTHLVADIFAGQQLMQEYRGRVANAVGEETEKKIFLGAQEGMVSVLEKDEATGEEKIVQKNADVFYAQPGSLFAMNFTAETSDAFDIRSHAEYYLESRIDSINKDLELGLVRAYNGYDILRKLGFNENAFGENEELLDKLLRYGISGNARKVPDAEMRKLKVTRLRGYQKQWDAVHGMNVFVPCLRLDFNFYPLEGKI